MDILWNNTVFLLIYTCSYRPAPFKSSYFTGPLQPAAVLCFWAGNIVLLFILLSSQPTMHYRLGWRVLTLYIYNVAI